jgi:hypothetical protein
MPPPRPKNVYAPNEKWKKVRPAESAAYFPNPHKGHVTFQHFHGDPPTPPPWSEQGPVEFGNADLQPKDTYPGCLPSTVAYCRWFWRFFEPERGRFNWDMVEGALKKARARGQTLHVRLQAFGCAGQPQLPEWFMESAPVRRHSGGYFDPVYDGPEYFHAWRAALQAFAERFDGRPGLDTLDMAFIGPWGEGAGQDGLVSRSRIDDFVEAYVALFKHTHLLANVGYQYVAGVTRGTGWCVDSFGDVACAGHGVVPDGTGWNHMYDAYPKRGLVGADAWQHAPVEFEWGDSIEHIRRQGYPLDFIIRQGLKYHGSFFMPRNLQTPEAFRAPLMNFAKSLGYRYVLRQVGWERRARVRDLFACEMWIENVGVAPIYHRYALALRFTQDDRAAVVILPPDPRKWLPGDTWISEPVRVPDGIREGEAMLDVALIDPATGAPRVNFAIEGAASDGWYELDTLEVSK